MHDFFSLAGNLPDAAFGRSWQHFRTNASLWPLSASRPSPRSNSASTGQKDETLKDASRLTFIVEVEFCGVEGERGTEFLAYAAL
ncbi:hypothetical protein [Rhizobium mayense]|uniref:Uncharacterized protein n=1 Tax=Rhizobium mayense TaxID=1312184 RepID=A0ABT7JQ55_9HYPH|nr:hypothetical protein [Rhizobium mayense]MDL2398474.1 hypothetical protein [Rhizobium mayense]